MDPTAALIGLDIGLVLTIIYVLDRNVFHAVDLILRGIPVWIALRYNQTVLGIRLRLDRARGPVGKLWNEYCLWQIRNNPAYKEFFNEQVQPESLPTRED
jgi:hypothetical protein